MDIDEVRPWLVVAERDLKAARNCLFGPEPTEEAAAYHCQQAAEKVVKAVLVNESIEVPYTHDLRILVGLLSTHPLAAMLRPLARFTPYATAYRYPIDDPLGVPPSPTIEEVEGWITEIEAVKEGLKHFIESCRR
jgi:HEPN domain-containing protein